MSSDAAGAAISRELSRICGCRITETPRLAQPRSDVDAWYGDDAGEVVMCVLNDRPGYVVEWTAVVAGGSKTGEAGSLQAAARACTDAKWSMVSDALRWEASARKAEMRSAMKARADGMSDE